MDEVFKSFCAFGQKGAAPLMDGSKLAKLTRDTKILDKKLTATDVDIIFAKSKPKTERKLTYAQFKDALKMMAEKKYPGDEGAEAKLTEVILKAKGPASSGTKAVKNAAVDRLTDTTKYTGAHKERFSDKGSTSPRAGSPRRPASGGSRPGSAGPRPVSGTGRSISQQDKKPASVKPTPAARQTSAPAKSATTKAKVTKTSPKETTPTSPKEITPTSTKESTPPATTTLEHEAGKLSLLD